MYSKITSSLIEARTYIFSNQVKKFTDIKAMHTWYYEKMKPLYRPWLNKIYKLLQQRTQNHDNSLFTIVDVGCGLAEPYIFYRNLAAKFKQVRIYLFDNDARVINELTSSLSSWRQIKFISMDLNQFSLAPLGHNKIDLFIMRQLPLLRTGSNINEWPTTKFLSRLPQYAKKDATLWIMHQNEEAYHFIYQALNWMYKDKVTDQFNISDMSQTMQLKIGRYTFPIDSYWAKISKFNGIRNNTTPFQFTFDDEKISGVESLILFIITCTLAYALYYAMVPSTSSPVTPPSTRSQKPLSR